MDTPTLAGSCQIAPARGPLDAGALRGYIQHGGGEEHASREDRMAWFERDKPVRARALVMLAVAAAALFPAGGEAAMWPRRLRGHLTITRTCTYTNTLPSPDGDCSWEKTETITITEARFRRATSPFPVMYSPVSGTFNEDSAEQRYCTYYDAVLDAYCVE